MNNISTHVPPGFRFYPTDEELVDYYLRRKINSRRIDLDVIKEVDLYKIEPWDLKEICRMGNEEEESDWYFFSHKDKKYPTGTRTNRATSAGFWKATGRDKAIYSKHELIGMRKTLVFYKGRAPNGQKSDWIMHEYRLETDENGPPQEEGWVVCRVSKKKATSTMRMNSSEHDLLCNWYDDQMSNFPPNFDSSKQEGTSQLSNNMHDYTRKTDILEHRHQHHHFPFRIPQEQHLIHLPNFNSKAHLPSHHGTTSSSNNLALAPFGLDIINQDTATTTIFPLFQDNNRQNVGVDNHLIDDANLDDLVSTDWRVLDKFVASQLSQEVVTATNNKENSTSLSDNSSKKEELTTDKASTSTTSSSKIDTTK